MFKALIVIVLVTGSLWGCKRVCPPPPYYECNGKVSTNHPNCKCLEGK